MRKELIKRILKTPHKRNINRFRSVRHLPADSNKESIKLRYKGGDYGVHEHQINYNILRRFLKHHVGQPWNKIYSDIRRSLDARSSGDYAVLRAIEHMVHQKLEYDANGRPIWFYSDGLPFHLLRGHLYVDQKGILQKF